MTIVNIGSIRHIVEIYTKLGVVDECTEKYVQFRAPKLLYKMFSAFLKTEDTATLEELPLSQFETQTTTSWLPQITENFVLLLEQEVSLPPLPIVIQF